MLVEEGERHRAHTAARGAGAPPEHHWLGCAWPSPEHNRQVCPPWGHAPRRHSGLGLAAATPPIRACPQLVSQGTQGTASSRGDTWSPHRAPQQFYTT